MASKASKKEKAEFQTGVQSAVADYNKAVKNATKLLADAQKAGKGGIAKQAQGFLDTLNSIAPMIETLKKAKSPTAQYTGPITQTVADQLNVDRANQSYGGVSGSNPKMVYAREADVKGFEGYASDAYYKGSIGTGISNTGKKYVSGKEVSDEQWSNFLITGTTPDGTAFAAGSDIALSGTTGDGTDTGTGTGGTIDSNVFGTGTGTSTGTGFKSTGAAGSEMWWSVLKSKLALAGLPATTINKSYDYFKNILTDFDMSAGADALDIVVDQFFTQSEYKSRGGQTFASPYYQDFGKFNEKLNRPKLPSELVPLVLGYKDLGAKYKISETYLVDDNITKYLQNDVSISEFDDRLNTASLKAQIADPQYTTALMKLGYINNPSQLKDFFLDPNIGTREMENRQKNAAFVTEAVRRVTPETQLQIDLDFAKQQAARYASQGYNEAQIASLAGTGYENVAQALPTGAKLAGIYDKEYVQAAQKATPAETATNIAAGIQSELQQEEFMNMTSSRLRALKERERRAFEGASGRGIQTSSIAGAF